MQAGCPHCGHLQTVDEDFLAGREKVRIFCTDCGKAFQVANPRLGHERAETTRRTVHPITSHITSDGRVLRIPAGKTLNLKVLEGNEKGTVYPLLAPRVTLGRTNADIIVDDPLSSRLHCALEISEEGVLLVDLESTNGTLVDGKRIQTVPLSDGATFQIGGHTFQLHIISEPE